MLTRCVGAWQTLLSFAQRPEEPDGPGRPDRPAPHRDRRANRQPSGPSPQGDAAGGRPSGGPPGRPSEGTDRLEAWRRRLPQLAGIGVLVAALVVLLWPGSPLMLGLGTLIAALTLLLILFVGLLVLLFRRRRSS
jgi:hypothetical protein